jgi:hypothetical protein
MKIQFKHYLHDDKEAWYFAVREALGKEGFSGDELEAAYQKTNMPFYEISFDLELDTETGKVTVLGSDL